MLSGARERRSETDPRSRARIEDAVAKAKQGSRAATRQAIGPRSFTESAVGHFVQADLRPAGIRNVPDHMCLNGDIKSQDGSGNQTPLGGKFTRTCSRGEDCGAF